MSPLRLIAVATATLAAACALAVPARAAAGCANAGYSYAGIQTLAPARGISAKLTVVRSARVTSGHVAAWLGVGGAGLGANGADAWIQVGVASLPGGTTELYYEVTEPGHDTVYTSLGQVGAGESHRVGVGETATSTWVVYLDGAAASPPVYLAGSHGMWSPMATSESYDGGITGCNVYSFEFSDVKTSTTAGVWKPVGKVQSFRDKGHSLRALAAGAFLVNRR
jgi:hypothetical protein